MITAVGPSKESPNSSYPFSFNALPTILFLITAHVDSVPLNSFLNSVSSTTLIPLYPVKSISLEFFIFSANSATSAFFLFNDFSLAIYFFTS